MVGRDDLIRMAALDYVDRLSDHGERALSWNQLNSFAFDGTPVGLVSQQGIFKPASLDLPISILTTYRPPGKQRPYEDEIDANGFLRYRYRGVDPAHYQNEWLRRAKDEAVVLLYLFGIATGRYLVQAAVVVDDDPASLTFGVALFDIDVAAIGAFSAGAIDIGTRRNHMALVRRRFGQAVFRESVLTAYGNRCTLCRLHRRELLDAAHIIPDSDGGPSVISNGMSMCKIHHAAYDVDIIGVRPDHVAEVRVDVLSEVDGPMLRHGLQELHGTRIHLPRSAVNRPDAVALESRYQRFRTAS